MGQYFMSCVYVLATNFEKSEYVDRSRFCCAEISGKQQFCLTDKVTQVLFSPGYISHTNAR